VRTGPGLTAQKLIVKNYAPNTTFDYAGCAAALWLER
jgi:hypothetical protein